VTGWIRLVLLSCVTGSLVLSAAGCKTLLKRRFGPDGGTATNATITPEDQADDQLQAKLDEYVKCLNSLSSSLHQTRRRYLRAIPRTGPKGTEHDVTLDRAPAGAAAACAAGVQKSNALPPSDAKLEAAGTEFADAASDVDGLLAEMDAYLSAKSYKDDRWAKGKALHPRLMASWDRFVTADKNLHVTVDGMTKPLAQRLLGRIERDEGRRYRYGRKRVLIAGRELIEASDPVGEDTDIDFTVYQTAFTDFEKALDELVTYGGQHKADLMNEKSAPNWPRADANYDQFVRASTDYKKTAKEFWRCLRDAPPRAKSQSGRIDREKVGSCGTESAWRESEILVQTYNDFIHVSNAHQFP
jgi:hypothetical protein